MRILLLLTSAVLLTLAQPPFPTGWLAYIALVPWLFALEGVRGRQAFALGMLWGLVFNLLGLHWIYNIGPEGVIALPAAMIYLALVWGVFTWLVGQVRGAWRPLVLPVLWTAFVWLLSLGEMGFPWLTLALTQTWTPAALQTAPLAGSWTIDLWVAAVNAMVYHGLARTIYQGGTTDLRRLARALAPAAALAVAVLLYGRLTLALGGAAASAELTRPTLSPVDPERPTWLGEDARALQVAAVGASVRPTVKLADQMLDYNLYLYERLTRAVQLAVGERLDLVVWPETAVPEYFHARYGKYLHIRNRVQALQVRIGVPILTGAFSYARPAGEERSWPYTSVFLVGERGITEGEGLYSKRILVPFGERVPYQHLLGPIKDWNLGWSDFGLARQAPLLGGPPAAPGLPRVGPLICYESIFARLVRPEVLAGARVLAVLSNDAWFGRTIYQAMQLKAAALRAVEFRRPLIRASNGGHSALIDRWGQIHSVTPLYTKDAAVGRVWPEAGLTPYARHGDWLPVLCLGLALAGLVTGREPRRAGSVPTHETRRREGRRGRPRRSSQE